MEDPRHLRAVRTLEIGEFHDLYRSVRGASRWFAGGFDANSGRLEKDVDAGGPFELVGEGLAALGDTLPAHAVRDGAQRVRLHSASEAVRYSLVHGGGF